MKTTKSRSMRNELSRTILGISSLTAFAFIFTSTSNFDRGLESNAQTAILMEVRSYEAEYRKNPDIPIPSSYNTSFFLDSWEKAPAFYKQAIPFNQLKPNRFIHTKWSPHGYIEWQDAHDLVAYWHKLPDNRDLYIIADYKANLLTENEKHSFDQNFYRVFYIAGSFFIITLVVVWFHNRRINRHTQQLAIWSESISLDNAYKSRPSFYYSELNKIAGELQSSYEKNASLLEREHQFLRYASHELRTPIAIISANLEIVNKQGIPEKITQPVDRITRANLNMHKLTETLLWLSRKNDNLPNHSLVALDQLLDEICEEFQYLFRGKNIKVIKAYTKNLSTKSLPETPLRIVLSNLIRNAFQHTLEGSILMTIVDSTVTIENLEKDHDSTVIEGGYGLGLTLANQICKQLHWELKLNKKSQGVKATLNLADYRNEKSYTL